jgi:hypothetical protein
VGLVEGHVVLAGAERGSSLFTLERSGV